ncbi:hypothetical protein ACU636_14695 [Klebsiella aerogenes]|uniref:hypothetical protein n=1 Tax=Klebsiella aerogenes TaxID=548 RepID=UPI0012DCB5FE|nr:hypothetical protein [Klebsiella aerogenes]HCU2312412.1 hypothetical protein [Klebsiella aerogenes]
MVEFVGDFDFLREREGAKRVAMVLIWKGFLYLVDFLLMLKYGMFVYVFKKVKITMLFTWGNEQ